MPKKDKKIRNEKSNKYHDHLIKNGKIHKYNDKKIIDTMNNVNTGSNNQNQTEMESHYRYLEHMTDLIVEAYGNNIEECFENSAIATINAMFDISKVEPTNKIKIAVHGFDLKNLLYNWLEKILLVIYIDRIVIRHFDSIRVKHIVRSNKNQILKEETVTVTPNNRNNEINLNKNNLFDISSKNKNEIYEIEAIGVGEAVNILKHDYKIEIKSVTYHEMEMRFDQDRRIRFHFILDL